jgi:DNA-binding transcriptional regulator YdaS (Cro superfamily)
MDSAPDVVAAYKLILKAAIERRPSGTRQKLAEAIGTHKSFVSQVTNPAYRVPLPAQHIPTLFRVCHFSPEEQRRFLDAYARAHPGQAGVIEELAGIDADVLRIPIPHFDDPATREEVESLIRDFAERVVALAQRRD